VEALAAAIITILAVGYVVIRAIVFAQALRQFRGKRRAEKTGALDRPPTVPVDERGDRRTEDGF
jgi:hypothetical protein